MEVDAARFERQYRTPNSEGYVLTEDGNTVGRLELHYTPSVVYCTLIVEEEVEEEALLDLIQKVDDELVTSAQVPREDFVVTVYHGKDLGVYSDDYFAEDEEEEDDERP
jgi:hypothetical protein